MPYYVSSKEALFDEVVRTLVERNFAMVKLITSLMPSYGENYPFMYIYIRENLSQVSDKRSQWSRYMRDLNKQTSDSVIAIIEQGYSGKSFRNIGSSRVVAYGIFGVIGWTPRWFRPQQGEVSAEEIRKIYAELGLAGLESIY